MPNSSNATPVAPGLVSRVAQGIRYAVTGVGPNDWFGPAQPIAPLAQDQAMGRVLDYRVGYNLSQRPREDEAVSFHQLRALADACNFLRLVIETRKDQMERLTWTIQPRMGSNTQKTDPRIAAVQAFFARPDGHNSWATWLRLLLEELLVTDAVAIYRRHTAGGQLYGLQQIDGATIKRVIDDAGLTPAAPDPAYQQILHGMAAVDYTADQLLYLPRNPRIHKLYGYSPVEQVVMSVNIALRRQAAQLNYFTEGNIPEALISCPPDWRPAQIREMQEIFDDMLRGNLAERSGAKFVPGGLSVQFTKDALLKDEFDEWLARIICYAFSVPPTPFIRQMNRATADSASDTGLQEGLAPLQNWVKALIDRVLAEDFAAPDLEFRWNEDRALSPAEAMSVNTGYVAAGLKTRNEVRADIGLSPLPGGDVALVTTATGLAPITPMPPVAKFDPSQPRNPAGQSDGGQWTSGGSGGASAPHSAGDLATHPQSGDAEAQLIPVQEVILPTTIPWEFVEPKGTGGNAVPGPYNIPSTPLAPSGSIVDPAIAVPYNIPDGLSASERRNCRKEWKDAYNDCQELDDQGELGKPYSGLGQDLDECAQIRVPEKCGGVPNKYKKNPRSVGESKA